MWKIIYVKHPKPLHNTNIQHNKYDGNNFNVETLFSQENRYFFIFCMEHAWTASGW